MTKGDDFVQEFLRSFDAVGASCDCLIKWPHKHFIHPEGIVTEFTDDFVRIDGISSSLGHLAAVFCHNKPYVMIFLEWFVVGDDSQIIQKFLPESGVNHVSSDVFGAAYVDVDFSSIFFTFFADKFFIIFWIHVTKSVS